MQKSIATKVSTDTWIKLGTYVAGGIAVAYGVKKVLDYFKPERKREQSETKDVANELEEAKKKSKASYPASQYSAFCGIIEVAIQDAGTDEAAIYSVFRKLKNDTDYLMLIKAWGSPKRQVYPDYILFYSFGYKMTLPQALRWDLDDKECAKVNEILKSKGIKYRI
jgi:hypothetical protein